MEAEGLRPLAARTGIPVGQIRSLLDGRAVRVTTLQSMTAVLGVRLTIGPGTGDPVASSFPDGAPASVRALANLSAAAFPAENREPGATALRDGVAIVKDLADRVAAAAQSLLQVVAGWDPATSPAAAGPPEIAPVEDRLVMIPFVSGAQVRSGRGAIFRDYPELTVGVAREVLPSWARPDRLICMRAAGDSLDMTVVDGDFVAFDPGHTAPVDQELFALATDAGPVVRRLRYRDRWLVVSDSATDGERPLSSDDHILGQVAWHGPRDRDASGDV